jgi:hypothetical protein
VLQAQLAFRGEDKTLKPEIEEFAKLLVTQVRDRAIVDCDGQLQTHSNSPTAKRWRENLKDAASKALAMTMIPDCVDDAVFHLLHAIDTGALRLSFTAANGTVIDLCSEGMGELAGWFMGSDAWRAKYSQQRFVDDFADLK